MRIKDEYLKELEEQIELDKRTIKPGRELLKWPIMASFYYSIAKFFETRAEKLRDKQRKRDYAFKTLDDLVFTLGKKQFPDDNIVKDGDDYYLNVVSDDSRLFVDYYECSRCGFVAGEPLLKSYRGGLKDSEFCTICHVNLKYNKYTKDKGIWI